MEKDDIWTTACITEQPTIPTKKSNEGGDPKSWYMDIVRFYAYKLNYEWTY